MTNNTEKILLKKLIVIQLVKRVPLFNGKLLFITIEITARHKILSWRSCVQFALSEAYNITL
jgi:aspartate-semialdehyde dehydrogenase